MPPFSRTIGEEGVMFDNFLLLEDGEIREQGLREQLGSGPWPARNPGQNVADLKAQLAANARGIAELEALIARAGLATVQRYMEHVQDNAEACVREVIGRLADGRMRYEMDDGSAIEVAVQVDRANRSAVVDFAGTSLTIGPGGTSTGRTSLPTSTEKRRPPVGDHCSACVTVPSIL